MRPRPPLVVGLHRGAGASTVAAGLHAHDGGLCGGLRERPADIVVCGSDTGSLALADALTLTPAGPRPVLAVTVGTTAPARARVRALEERFGAVVLLPDVARWHGLVRPLDEVGALLAQPGEHLPRPMRHYAAALRHLAAAVLRSGQLDRPVPPLVGTAPALVRSAPCGVRPVEVRHETRADAGAAARPVLVSAPRPVRPIVLAGRPHAGRMVVPVPDVVVRPAGAGFDLDDETLEAAVCSAAGRAG